MTTQSGDSGATRDTAQKSAAQAWQLLDAASDAMIGVSDDLRITFVNRGASTIFGLSPEQLTGRELRWLLPDYVLDPQGEGGERSETLGVHNDGRELVLEVFVVRHSDGARTLVARDLSERRALEQQLRQSQKLETVGRLAGGVAHDFNNLLTIITGHAEFLLKHLGPRHRLRGLVREVKKASDRATSLTRQLLAFSRPQTLAPQLLDLNATVGSIERTLRRIIGEDVELKTVLQFGLGEVKADPAQLEQVILNLALNARDAMPTGGKLTLETRQVELVEGALPERVALAPGRYVLLSMSDTGQAVDPAAQQQLFDPLPGSPEGTGRSGLGLATVYEIVEQNGGQVTVSSDGSGTRFDVYLPVAQESGELIDLSKARDVLRPGSETVLLVEDEDAVRKLLRASLQRRGYTVFDARDGAEALEIASKHDGPIHLLVSDVIMPRMSGPELADQLAVDHPEMRLLFISGYTDDTVTQHRVLESATSFLQKPFTPDQLTQRVREVLEPGAPAAEPRPRHAPGAAPPPIAFPASARGSQNK